MKKIFLCIFIILLTGCVNNKELKKIEISNNDCYIEKDIDTHGGFLGDGEYFAKIICPNLKVSELSNNWKSLPIKSEINEIMNLKMCDDKKCANPLERYEIPDIEEGYYYFIDRHSDAIDRYDSFDLNNRSSYNFSLAIWDNNKTIYYYKLDT